MLISLMQRVGINTLNFGTLQWFSQWFFMGIEYLVGSSGSVCSRSVPVLICPPSKVTFLGGTCPPARRAGALGSFKTKPQKEARRERRVAGAPLGGEKGIMGDYLGPLLSSTFPPLSTFSRSPWVVKTWNVFILKPLSPSLYDHGDDAGVLSNLITWFQTQQII